MNPSDRADVESLSLTEFVPHLQAGLPGASIGSGKGKLNLDPDAVKNGVAQLVLTLVKLLHELLEQQALRRIDGGTLSDAEVERMGVTLMKQAEVIEKLRVEFGLDEDDLNLDLGPLGKLL